MLREIGYALMHKVEEIRVGLFLDGIKYLNLEMPAVESLETNEDPRYIFERMKREMFNIFMK